MIAFFDSLRPQYPRGIPRRRSLPVVFLVSAADAEALGAAKVQDTLKAIVENGIKLKFHPAMIVRYGDEAEIPSLLRQLEAKALCLVQFAAAGESGSWEEQNGFKCLRTENLQSIIAQPESKKKFWDLLKQRRWV